MPPRLTEDLHPSWDLTSATQGPSATVPHSNQDAQQPRQSRLGLHRSDTTRSSVKVTEDGRIALTLNVEKNLPKLPNNYAKDFTEFAVDVDGFKSPPPMNIVVMIVGSRGDVQPYLALGQRLRKDGHRVRIATHETFRSFIRDAGLEFFNIGGDPHELMSYMVKNPGLIPGYDSLTNGDISRKRKMLKEMLDGCWKACHSIDDETGQPFAADAIISNPPTFAHVHCAEALGVPLTMTFTMPWSPTTSFHHPLVNVKRSNALKTLTNYYSYVVTDLMMWQGMGDIVDSFRMRTLGMLPLSLQSGPGILERLKVPWTYCMSPSLVPKPEDWQNHIDVVGFYFLNLSSSYSPPEDLIQFLNSGPPPVYIGFGSVVVDDPQAMTETIFEAVKRTGVRALVSAGWGGLGGSSIPSNIFILGNVPHDWLFDKVAAVCHHGGAGTTAIGLRMGKPTIVVPFFGDQPFWGDMIYQAGAGPKPIPHKQLNSHTLAEAIRFVMRPEAQAAAQKLGEKISSENGVDDGVISFYRHLPLLNMRCDLDPSKLAVWWSQEHCLRLSAFAATTLAGVRMLNMDRLKLHRSREYYPTYSDADPFTGTATCMLWAVSQFSTGIAQMFYRPVEGLVNTTISLPLAFADLLHHTHDSLVTIPRLYGSGVREQRRVDGLGSGLLAGAQEVALSAYDAVTGLVVEPVVGAMNEGTKGALKGLGRGVSNALILPTAGALGFVTHSMRGASRSIAKAWHKYHERVHRQTRVEDGHRATFTSTEEEKRVIIEAFRHAIKSESVKTRKKAWKEMMKTTDVEGNGRRSGSKHRGRGKGKDDAEFVVEGPSDGRRASFSSPRYWSRRSDSSVSLTASTSYSVQSTPYFSPGGYNNPGYPYDQTKSRSHNDLRRRYD